MRHGKKCTWKNSWLVVFATVQQRRSVMTKQQNINTGSFTLMSINQYIIPIRSASFRHYWLGYIKGHICFFLSFIPLASLKAFTQSVLELWTLRPSKDLLCFVSIRNHHLALLPSWDLPCTMNSSRPLDLEYPLTALTLLRPCISRPIPGSLFDVSTNWVFIWSYMVAVC